MSLRCAFCDRRLGSSFWERDCECEVETTPPPPPTPGSVVEPRVLPWERERECEPESSWSVMPALALPVWRDTQNVLVRGMAAVMMERRTTDLWGGEEEG
jgi:hypothetical protein